MGELVYFLNRSTTLQNQMNEARAIMPILHREGKTPLQH